jgi:hypothetical protein
MLRMQIQTLRFGSYTDVDLAAEGCGKFVLTVSYSMPAVLRWTVYQAQHTTPLAYRGFIRFWDDAANDPDGDPFSEDNPIFEGFIEEIEPKESRVLEYAAYDPTYVAGKEIAIMSVAWPAGDVPGGVPPSPQASAVPRLIFNSSIDNDDDWAFQRGPSALTVGNMLATILQDEYHPLYWSNAAPGDGTSAGNGQADVYVTAEVDAMTIIPQEKMVFQSETLRTAIDRLVGTHYPQRRLVWKPGARVWGLPDLSAATARTVTLNDYSGTNKVLSMELHRSIERRATAVRFYGPETTTITVASTQDGSLQNFGNQTVLESMGSVDVVAFRQWRITNPNRRRMGRMLPTTVMAPVGGYTWIPTRSPSLQMTWDGSTWLTIWGAYFDYQGGIASTFPGFVFFWSSGGEIVQTGVQHYFPPVGVRLVYSFFDVPLSVRYPTSGWAGTAYTVANIEHELKIYDEMLAIGFERGTPVTSAARLSQYSALAQQLHTEAKDVVYAGGMTFDGIEYDWCRLDRRCHIAGDDGSGNTVATGWESIGAWVTDVEYDFDQRITTIQFSSDQAELMGLDVEVMKERLGIRALQRRTRNWARFLFAPFMSDFSWRTTQGMRLTGVESGLEIFYVDPVTGEVHNPL